MAEPVVLINVFEVPADQAEQFIAAWEQTREFMRAQPGYLETALHHALTPDTDFLFVNIARWRTPEAFAAAIGSPEFRKVAADIVGYRQHPGLYRIVRT
jgi:heme oxygenase (mycobilin-producing)